MTLKPIDERVYDNLKSIPVFDRPTGSFRILFLNLYKMNELGTYCLENRVEKCVRVCSIAMDTTDNPLAPFRLDSWPNAVAVHVEMVLPVQMSVRQPPAAVPLLRPFEFAPE